MTSMLPIEAVDAIDDAQALALRDDVVVPGIIADACQVMPSIRKCTLSGVSPYAVHRALLADAPVHPLALHTTLLRAGLKLGVIDISSAPTIGNA